MSLLLGDITQHNTALLPYHSNPTAFVRHARQTRLHLRTSPLSHPRSPPAIPRVALRASNGNCQGSQPTPNPEEGGDLLPDIPTSNLRAGLHSLTHLCKSSFYNGVHRGGHLQPGAAIPCCKSPLRAATSRYLRINTLLCSKLKLSSCSAKWS